MGGMYMDDGRVVVNFEQMEYTLSVLGKCTDDYMYIWDMKRDYYAISKRAVKAFKLSKARFYNTGEVLKSVVYPEDLPRLEADLAAIKERGQRTHNMEYRWLDTNGVPVWISCRGEVVLDEEGEVHYLVGRISEIGKKNKIDKITSLYNENILKQYYQELVEKQDIYGYMMVIGIDNFKEINEKYGYDFGNKILANMADIIKGKAINGESVYRMEGDCVVILDYKNVQSGKAKELYKRIRSAIDESIEENGYKMFHTISAGAVYFDSREKEYDKLMEQVNFALHSAKLQGKNTFVLYNQKEYESYIRRLDIQECLRRAIENDFKGFELYYQPIMDVEMNTIHGAEALIRWNSEKYGFMSPVEFIPLLEESSLIIPLGRWILETALKQCQIWQGQVSDFRMNINLSFVQLQKSNMLADAEECIRRIGIDVNNVVFEVTESGEIETNQATQNVLKGFRDRSISLAIDDFGTGYSNLRYIKEKMFDLIKIDRIFIQNIMQNEYDYILVKHVTELAHSMNLMVCYEGVETEEELESVKRLRPDYIQGYYYGKPMNAAAFTKRFFQSGI
ncbi:MAG: EAL domain-containing protein [Lachnospiraceae bacterium]|nr:EAL domain-containing protein [Lachnospiraceae bacterium]